MKKVLLVFWPLKGNVETVADKIVKKSTNLAIQKKSIKEISDNDLNQYDNWIIGCSTVGSHTWHDADDSNLWFDFFKRLNTIDLSKKFVAFYGLGDQVLYPHHFVNELGVFQEEFENRQANITGQWPTEGYNFSDSEGMKKGYFYGLALDEDHQKELTDERIEKWLELVEKDFK